MTNFDEKGYSPSAQENSRETNSKGNPKEDLIRPCHYSRESTITSEPEEAPRYKDNTRAR
jgi:hypothetical protein